MSKRLLTIAVLAAFITPALAFAATTVGTNIDTAGTLSVTGAINASSTINVGNAVSAFTSGLQGWTYAINNINRINTDPSDGIAGFGVNIQSISGAEGLWSVAYVTGNSNTADGVTADANVTGNNSTAIGAETRASAEVGSGGTLYGVQASAGASNAASVTTAAGVNILSAFTFTGGSILNNYGLLINSQTSGTNNWAIKTGLGKVSFGDKVGIGTTTPSTPLVVTAGASATTTVTISELGLSSSKGCVNINASDGSASSFYVNAAHALVVEPNYCR